jgi:uncharacterized protein YjbI with pentapeptide repeats
MRASDAPLSETGDPVLPTDPAVERFLHSIGKNEGDIQNITLETDFENLKRNYDEADLLQILGKDDWSELEAGDLAGITMKDLSVVFRSDGCLIVAEHIIYETFPTGLNLGDVLEVKHFSDDNYGLIRIIEGGDRNRRDLTVAERDEMSGYRRSTAFEEERKEKERQAAADLERIERQATADLKRSQSDGKLLNNGAEKRGFAASLLALRGIASICGVVAVVGILFIIGVFSGEGTGEARFTPSSNVGKDVELLFAEIDFENYMDINVGKTYFKPRGFCIDCDLRGVNLAGKTANMSWFGLSGSDFSGADLEGANFYGADLSEVNFSGANLKNAVFTSAILYGANLDNVFNAPQGISMAHSVPDKYRYDPKKETWVSKD